MKFSAILASVSAAAQAATLTPRDDRPISVPTTKPVDAIVVPKNFVGFGIESAFFTAFNNNFSSNLVTALADRMGAPPVIRVGGTGGDYLKFNPDQKEAAVCREGERDAECGSHLAGYTLGPSFFDTFRDRFKNARFIVQAPLNNPVNMTNSLAYVTKAWEALGGGDRVEAIALGNEVEFIYKGGQADAYVKAALEIQDSIVKKLGLGGETAAIFEAGNTASGSVKSPNDPERPSYKV
ncbi:hypothetical protein IMZ48_28165 [Candidatus Bathyarchaeota archaeon]|nr:hypothetical protein [Candidatus Bathyarchaeota archaeon]